MAKYKFIGNGYCESDRITELFESNNSVYSLAFENDVKSFLKKQFPGEEIHGLEIDMDFDERIIVSFGVSYGDYDWGLTYEIKAV